MSQDEIIDTKKCPKCSLDTLAHGNVIEVKEDAFFGRSLMKVASFNCIACDWKVEYIGKLDGTG